MQARGSQTALITGAAQRIGRSLALTLAEHGMNVVVHHRHSAEQAERVCAAVADRGMRAWPLPADLGDPDAVAGLVECALALSGSLDVLVNNASLFSPDAIADVSFEAIIANLRVNTWAPLLLSRSFARLVGRGKIVNLLDTKLASNDRTHVAYLLSKHLLAVVTRMTALEFAPHITVNAVAPGLILPPAGQDEAYLEALAAGVPLRRHGTAADVADAVVFLWQSTFITGQVIHVDGGAHLGDRGQP
jgi:NAD(P)-dependent dehydrogenase (short-subunit alcohol dehydrogenase family)